MSVVLWTRSETLSLLSLLQLLSFSVLNSPLFFSLTGGAFLLFVFLLKYYFEPEEELTISYRENNFSEASVKLLA